VPPLAGEPPQVTTVGFGEQLTLVKLGLLDDQMWIHGGISFGDFLDVSIL
jgi:uncharacterized protein YegJ (DUF2314 family)